MAGTGAPQLPPLLSGRVVAPPRRPLEVALARAEDPEAEAGELYWLDDPDTLELALLLLPEVAAERAQEMLPLAMVALGDAIGALAEPQMGITFGWPGTVLANGAAAGQVGLELPDDSIPGAIPDWLLLRVRLALRPAAPAADPGLEPSRTTLWDEGAGDLARDAVLEAFARHLLAWLNRWEDEGFGPLHASWLARADGLDRPLSARVDGAAVAGVFTGLDEHGGALLRTDAGTRLATVLDNRGGA